MKTTLYVITVVGILFPLGTLGAIYFAMQQESSIYGWFFAAWIPVIIGTWVHLRAWFRLRAFLKLQDNRF